MPSIFSYTYGRPNDHRIKDKKNMFKCLLVLEKGPLKFQGTVVLARILWAVKSTET